MRVLVIPGYFGFGGSTPSGSNGSGVFFRDQAVALARAGHEVTLLYVHFDSARGRQLDVSFEDRVRFLFVHAARWPRLNAVHRMLLMIWAVRKAFAPGSRPDVVHAHIFHALPSAWAVARAFRIPYVVTEHSSKVRAGSLGGYWRTVARLGYARAARVMAVSHPLAESLARYTSQEVLVVPNLVRDEVFASPLCAKPRAGTFTFLSVGYCDPIKGWDLLLEAFAQLAERGYDVRLLLCGATCPDLEQSARRLGISQQVHFTGRLPAAEIPTLLGSCDCHVMPSRVETFGIASIEALACGRPVIMTDTGAASTIVALTNGLVVGVEDVEAMATAMAFMIENADAYDPAEIRRSCRSNFSASIVAATLSGVFTQVLEEGGR